MWSSRRAFLCVALLAGCGFTPAYGVKSPGRALYGQIELAEPATRDDFDFVAAVEAQLGRPGPGARPLAYKIETTPVGVGYTADGAITRYTLTGKVTWTLGGDDTVTGSYETFTGYSATGTTLAGITAETDAHRRLMQMLAEGMVRRLLMAAP